MRFPKVTPEVDTVRIWFCVEHSFDLQAFFENECKSCFASFQVCHDEEGNTIRRPDGSPVFSCTWEKFRADMACSWWGKMQITVATAVHKVPIYGYYEQNRVLQVEYSVAKWHNITNGVNRGVPPSKYDILFPIFFVLSSMNISKYVAAEWSDNWQKLFLKNCQIRRLDLSYNFLNDDVDSLMVELSICRLNNKKGDPIVKDFSTETLNFGGSRGSLYKAMFYNKEKEQKNYFSKSGLDNSLEEEENKKLFYKKNSEYFKNVIRFEVQYHSKYFYQHFKNDYKFNKGVKMIDNIINLCSFNYGELLKKFDEQLKLKNVRPENEYTLYDDCMNKLENIRLMGGLSNCQCANLKLFVEDCFKWTWQKVRSSMSQQTFSVKYLKVKKLTGLDLKVVCVTQLPIMRIMDTVSAYDTWRKTSVIKPSYIMNFAV